MAEAQDTTRRVGGLSDLGYVPSVLAGVLGTRSIVSLAQTAFDAGNLYAPVQAVLQSDNDGLRVVSLAIEPPVLPALEGFGG